VRSALLGPLREHRARLVDGATAVVLAAGSLPALWLGDLGTGITVARDNPRPAAAPFLAVVLLGCGALLARRHRPVAVALVAVAAFAAAKVLRHPTVPADLALLVASYSVTVHGPPARRVRAAVVGGLGTVVAAVTAGVLAAEGVAAGLVAAGAVAGAVVVVLVPAGLGRAAWRRRELHRELEDRLAEATARGEPARDEPGGPAVVGDRWAALTPREREVLDLIADGRTNAQIAAELGIGRETVKSHVGRVLHKLGVEHRTQAAVLALRRARTVPPPPTTARDPDQRGDRAGR
jgi:DNA-binding CsgD family transcriptional regulator